MRVSLIEREKKLREFFKDLRYGLSEEEIEDMEMARQAMEEKAKIPESEKIILDSPKFTSFAPGMKDDGTMFTDEDTEKY